ncbi:hypothetical protein N7490_006587 [Penicillium lividum]|nr:hypothetical protein N7490_006587 [Penicillium lividum]
MPVPASAWPTLVSGTGRTAPADTTARLLNANHDTKTKPLSLWELRSDDLPNRAHYCYKAGMSREYTAF